ncbi:MAG: shikimate dehydrogenase family protein [Bacteroidales bacterium]
MANVKALFGLIGFPLSHSWSPAWFNEKFRSTGEPEKEYRLFPLAGIEEFPRLLVTHPALAGLNVTIPYKELVIPFVDVLDQSARDIGAVNAIRITRADGRITTEGFNTDATGFFQTLTDSVPPGPALVLGTGGGAKAICHALRLKNIPYTMVSRSGNSPGSILYNDLTAALVQHHLLIINATPLGMYPNIMSCPPIPYHLLTPDHFLYDLVYNPEETEFIRQGKLMHANTMNGSRMLINQAELSYRIFNSASPV